MKIGDIVKLADTYDFNLVDGVPVRYEIPGGIVRAQSVAIAGGLPYINGVSYKERDVELMTVADLFREAGFPVPEGARLWYVLGGCPYLWIINDGDDIQKGWLRKENGRPGWHRMSWKGTYPDLARLPAADAWDCLPEAVKAVVGQNSRDEGNGGEPV